MYFAKLSFFSSQQSSDLNFNAVSVLVCAKNETENLKRLIPLLLDQDHPNYEIILINDRSTDNSLEVMEAFAERHAHIKIVNVAENENFWGSKKYALTLGIKKATYNHLLFTDADCIPASKEWIKLMTMAFIEDKKIVLGYGAYTRLKNSWLNKIIRYETVITALQYLGYALHKNTYMGVGRNLAYTVDTFNENRGFVKHFKIPSGDDDLFINGAATSTNTSICINPKAFTYSVPKQRWNDWFRQKRRHTSVAKYYKSKHKIQLAGFYISQILFLLLSIWLLCSSVNLIYLLPAIALRYLIAWFVIGRTCLKLLEKDLIVFFPILEAFLILLQMSIFITNSFAKPRFWN